MDHPLVQVMETYQIMDHLQIYDSSISHAEMIEIIKDHFRCDEYLDINNDECVYKALGYKAQYSLYQVYYWLGYR